MFVVAVPVIVSVQLLHLSDDEGHPTWVLRGWGRTSLETVFYGLDQHKKVLSLMNLTVKTFSIHTNNSYQYYIVSKNIKLYYRTEPGQIHVNE